MSERENERAKERMKEREGGRKGGKITLIASCSIYVHNVYTHRMYVRVQCIYERICIVCVHKLQSHFAKHCPLLDINKTLILFLFEPHHPSFVFIAILRRN